MCEIAPFEMKCKFEKENCLTCYTHKMNFALTDLIQRFPIVGKFIDDYQCPLFEINDNHSNFNEME